MVDDMADRQAGDRHWKRQTGSQEGYNRQNTGRQAIAHDGGSQVNKQAYGQAGKEASRTEDIEAGKRQLSNHTLEQIGVACM